MARINLTDRFIASRKAAPPGRRQDHADAIVPGLALRVTDKGHKSFVLVARYPTKPANPTRRALGDYGELSLDDAREKARDWLQLIKKGKDPKIEEARQKALEQRRQAVTFDAVADAFIERYVKGRSYVELERLAAKLRTAKSELTEEQAFREACADPKNKRLVARLRLGPKEGEGIAKKDEAQRIIRAEFVKRWKGRPAADILPEEVSAAIGGIVKRGAPYQAHNALGYLRRLFTWAMGTQEFGLMSSPVERISPKDLIGEREARSRILTDDELRAVWQATFKLGYPYGPLFRQLIRTGQREREVADAQRAEISADEKLWTIPADRMKGGRAHEVPLAPMAFAEFKALPEFTGPHLFTTTAGEKPVNGFSKAKARLDKLSGVADWKIHDLRRTMRTHLSALPVEDLVRELVIAHAKPGLHKVYDLHAYQDEKRRCLELWEQRLDGIVDKKQADVTVLAERRARARPRRVVVGS